MTDSERGSMERATAEVDAEVAAALQGRADFRYEPRRDQRAAC